MQPSRTSAPEAKTSTVPLSTLPPATKTATSNNLPPTAEAPEDPAKLLERGADKHVIHRVTILDRSSSCPLFDCIYSWKTDDRSPATSAKLISLFNSIASTFKDDSPTPRRVIFEQKSTEVQRKTKKQVAMTSLMGISGGQSKPTQSSAAKYMMAETKDSPSASELELFHQFVDSICVAVYLKPARYISDTFQAEFLGGIGDDFLLQHKSNLLRLKPTFDELARDQEVARNTLTCMHHFKDFRPRFSSDFVTEATPIVGIGASNDPRGKKDSGPVSIPLSSDLLMAAAAPTSGNNPTTATASIHGSHHSRNSLPVMNDIELSDNVLINRPKFLPEISATPKNEHQLPSNLTTTISSTSSNTQFTGGAGETKLDTSQTVKIGGEDHHTGRAQQQQQQQQSQQQQQQQQQGGKFQNQSLLQQQHQPQPSPPQLQQQQQVSTIISPTITMNQPQRGNGSGGHQRTQSSTYDHKPKLTADDLDGLDDSDFDV